MTKKIIDLIFEVDNNFSLLNSDDCNWFNFFNTIINSGSNRINVYVVLKQDYGLENIKSFATKFKRKIDYKNISFCQYVLPIDIEKNQIDLVSLKDNKKVYIDNDNTIFFTTSKEVIEVLYMQNIFSVFLNIDVNKYDEKENKQIYKMSNIFITSKEISKYSYESINYEFLTFLEKNEN